jgi:ABC-type glycerol-3-phosphate transport system permease component
VNSLVFAFQIEIFVGALCAFVIFYMQVRGYRRHRKQFFVTLAISTVFAVAATFMRALPYFVQVPESQSVMVYWLSIPLAILATALATWGSVQFFQAFDDK